MAAASWKRNLYMHQDTRRALRECGWKRGTGAVKAKAKVKSKNPGEE
jgi:hypothetical protein